MRLHVLLAVTHLVGAGHLTRTAAIGRALAAAGHAVTLVSGGLPSRLIPLTGLALVQLPPVRAFPGDYGTLRDEAGEPAGPERLAARRDALLRAFASARPDVVVTELFPFGRRALAAEFEGLLGAAASAGSRPLVLCSARDVLVAPTKPGRAEAVRDRLRESYGAVLVHGDPDVLPLERSWPVTPDIRALLRYTGYVDAGAGAEAPASPDGRRPGSVLVSGGSSAASVPLYRAALGAAAKSPDLLWHVLAGPGVPDDTFADLAHRAPPNARLERARRDFRDLMREAAVFVGQAGYNTVMDIVATRTPSVLVPLEAGRETEQRLRAEAFAARGLAAVLPEPALTPRSLLAAVRTEGAGGRTGRAAEAVRRDGAAATVALIETLAAARTAGRGTAGPA